MELARAAAQREQEAEPTPGRVRGLVHQFDPMAASRAARKREMIANLENEEYLTNLVEDSSIRLGLRVAEGRRRRMRAYSGKWHPKIR